MHSIKYITGCSRLNKAIVTILLLIASLLITESGTAPLQEQTQNKPTIQGRLLSENKNPIAGATLSLCITKLDSSGRVGVFVMPDVKGSMRVSYVKKSASSETTIFVEGKNGWLTVRTQEDGRFAIDDSISFGKYYLAADHKREDYPQKLISLSGDTIRFQLSAKSPKVDLGDVIVYWYW